MAPLGAGDFEDFFRALHDVEPFPWQTRLLKQVAESGRWTSLLDLPTGTGKTAALEVALFYLALEAPSQSGNETPWRTPGACRRSPPPPWERH